MDLSTFLCFPAPGDTSLSRLRRKVHMLALRALVGSRFELAGGRALARLRPLLVEILRREPDRLLAAVGSQDVLPGLLCLQSGACAPQQALSAAIPSLLAELGGLPEDLLWEAPVGTLLARGRRWELGGEGLLVGPAGLSLRDGRPLEELPSQPLGRAVGPWTLALSDSNPLADVEAHPDKEGNALSLGERSPEQWQAAFAEAWALIEQALPAWASEGMLQRVVPVGFEAERHVSASFMEAPGLAYLSLHPRPLQLAEALIHETQHSKLNLLRWLDPVLHNGDSAWTRSPVRPDLRPLIGVLLAAHAFVPVAAFYQALGVDPQRLRAINRLNGESLAILEQARPSAAGARVLDGLRGLHARLVEAA